MYTGSRGGGIQIIIVASPSQPQILATFSPPYLEAAARPPQADAAPQTGDMVITADSRFGLRLLDLRRTGQAAIRLVPLKTAWAVAHTHNVVAVAKGVDGVELHYLSPHLLRTVLRTNRTGTR